MGSVFEGVQTDLEILLLLHLFYCFSRHSEEEDDEEEENVEKATEIPKKKLHELEKLCEKCQRKMSVKFDFDKMESDGDPDAWVVFNCSMCTSREDLDEDE